MAVAVFLFFWGNLFVPKSSNFPEDAPRLRVMTFNTLGFSTDAQPAVDVILATEADVVFIQELNTALARAAQEQMMEMYPYQLLDPRVDLTGMGLLSKYPIELSEASLPAGFLSTPQLLVMDWEGQKIELINFHMWPTGLSFAYYIEENFRQREGHAQAIDDRAAKSTYPLIAGGDANTTSLNTAYTIMTRNLTDVWTEAGFGFGHTFPDGQETYPFALDIPSWAIPQWIIRIDYILVSDDWGIEAAYLAPYDGSSDHRAVVTELVFLGER